MLFLHPENCKKKKDQLTHFKGFLPFQFEVVIDTVKREKYLKSIGLWKDISIKEKEVIKGMRENYPDDGEYLEAILRQWLIENPQFQDCIIFKD